MTEYINVEEKECINCKEVRPLSKFPTIVRNKGTEKAFIYTHKVCTRCKGKMAYKKRNEKHPTYYADKSRFYRNKNREFYILYGAKHRAKKRGLDFSITREDIFIPDVCPLIGIPLCKDEGPLRDGSPSLDRIDPQKGYTPDNVWVISNKANRMKNDSSLAELELLVNNFRLFLEGRNDTLRT